MSDFLALLALLLSMFTFYWTTLRRGTVVCSPIPYLNLVRGKGFWALCMKMSLLASGSRNVVVRRLFGTLEYEDGTSIGFPGFTNISTGDLGTILAEGGLPVGHALPTIPFLPIPAGTAVDFDACFYGWEPETLVKLGKARFIAYAEILFTGSLTSPRTIELFDLEVHIHGLPSENSYLGCADMDLKGRFSLDDRSHYGVRQQ